MSNVTVPWMTGAGGVREAHIGKPGALNATRLDRERSQRITYDPMLDIESVIFAVSLEPHLPTSTYTVENSSTREANSYFNAQFTRRP
jgi:hypothetical protein